MNPTVGWNEAQLNPVQTVMRPMRPIACGHEAKWNHNSAQLGPLKFFQSSQTPNPVLLFLSQPHPRSPALEISPRLPSRFPRSLGVIIVLNPTLSRIQPDRSKLG